MDILRGISGALFPLREHIAMVTDPPYGINAEAGTNCFRAKNKNKVEKWDIVPTRAVFESLFALSKHQIIVGGNYFNLPVRGGWLCWYKGSQIKGRQWAEVEMAWTSLDIKARHIECEPFILGSAKIHPTQKPIKVMRWCLSLLPAALNIIIDPFMGSGTTGAACVDAGLRFIGIEKNETYFEAARARIADAVSQGELFPANRSENLELGFE